ncbi:ATP-binding protein [Pedobacter sp. Hv1]|uniref:ATP-binding protein n=1 Tax=Pedobacter sp. Hv1 TaxID=1740090 RepID=UPI0006D8B761|nr:ATP-binding protein [Pedobacter sp. Hv1]KQC00153.1 hypothetical protein AQF98_11650 [Pedobacter sp. Hv1]
MKYIRTLSTICLTVWSTLCVAQQDKHLQMLTEKRKACETIMASFNGKTETIDLLIKEGEAGLKIVKPKEYNYKFLFSSAVGTGYYYKQNFKLAKQYFELAYETAKEGNMVSKGAKVLGNLISIYHYVGMQGKADSAAQRLKQIVETTDTLKSKTDIYFNLGMYNQQQKFYYGIALSNFLKSVELHKPIVDTTKILKLKLDYGSKLMMVAEIYLYLKQPNKALEYLNQVKPYLNSSVVIDVAAYGKLIRSYALLNNKTEALKYYNLLHKVVGDKPGRWSELVSSSLEMGLLAVKEKDFKLAKTYIDKADKQSKIDNNEVLTCGVNQAYGDYYKAMDNKPLAIKYYKMAEHGAALYNKEQYSDLLKALTQLEMASGNSQVSADYFSKYVVLSDSLSQRKISLNLAEMEAKFQNESKKREIGVLNRENEAKNLQLKQERNTRWLLIGGAFLLFVALLSIYLNFRNKQKANLLLNQKNKQLDLLNEQLTGANQTKAKLFSIISHDLRSPVSQLFTFLKLQQANPNYISEEEKSQHQKKLMQSSSSLLATMEDLLLWSKSQMEHFELDIETIAIAQLFEEATLLMQNQAEAKELVIATGNVSLANLQSDQNLLIIVLRNLLQNAINHAYPNTSIYLNAAINEAGKPYLSILNQGDVISIEKINELMTGNNVKSKSSGYGLLIVKELLGKINASLDIKSDEKGTQMTVVFLG